MKGPASNTPSKTARIWNGFGVDHRLLYPIWFASVDWNTAQTGGVSVVLTEGLRSTDRQADLRRIGASQTLNSKHIIGMALDVAILVGGVLQKDVDPWYSDFAKAVARWDADYNGQRLIRWGGDWKTLADGAHFEL